MKMNPYKHLNVDDVVKITYSHLVNLCPIACCGIVLRNCAVCKILTLLILDDAGEKTIDLSYPIENSRIREIKLLTSEEKNCYLKNMLNLYRGRYLIRGFLEESDRSKYLNQEIDYPKTIKHIERLLNDISEKNVTEPQLSHDEVILNSLVSKIEMTLDKIKTLNPEFKMPQLLRKMGWEVYLQYADSCVPRRRLELKVSQGYLSKQRISPGLHYEDIETYDHILYQNYNTYIFEGDFMDDLIWLRDGSSGEKNE